MTSAVAIPACTLAAHLFQRRPHPGFWPAWIISALFALGFMISRISIAKVISAHHVPFTFQTMATFWLQIIAWPISLAPIGALFVIMGVIALIISYRQNQHRNATNATILALGVYAAVNALFIVKNRVPSEWHMRHWDINALFPLAMLAAVLSLLDLKGLKRPVLFLTGALALCHIFYAGNLIRTVSWPYLKAAHSTRSAALEHYQTLLLHRDLREENRRFYERCEKQGWLFFDDPIGRFTVPPQILENLVLLEYRPLALLSPEIVPNRSPSKFGWFTKELITHGWVLVLFGILLAISVLHKTPKTNESV